MRNQVLAADFGAMELNEQLDKCMNFVAKSSGGKIRTFGACRAPMGETPKPGIKLSQL